jgi:hypothetical protein
MMLPTLTARTASVLDLILLEALLLPLANLLIPARLLATTEITVMPVIAKIQDPTESSLARLVTMLKELRG